VPSGGANWAQVMEGTQKIAAPTNNTRIELRNIQRLLG
jgi:hypothetical protein